jgi:hypothetical protein
MLMSRNRSRTVASRRTAALVLLASLALAAPLPEAGEPTAESRAAANVLAHNTLAEIEETFWVCDHASTFHGLDSDTAAACVVVAGEVRRRKFAGDFGAMLDWWQRNKAREHRQVEERYPLARRR